MQHWLVSSGTVHDDVYLMSQLYHRANFSFGLQAVIASEVLTSETCTIYALLALAHHARLYFMQA